MTASLDEATAAAAEGAEPLSVADARRAWAQTFRDHGIDSPELDARILVGHALGLDHTGLAAAHGRVLSVTEENAVAALAHRRLAREPAARIIGWKEFWSLRLCIDATTLVPRPETETAVEATLAAIDARGPRTRSLRLVDLGTGCGAILLALLRELPNAFGVGIDTSIAALAIARSNAAHHLIERAQFVASDMTAALRGPFDIVVSNPPYVASADIAALAPEVRDYDPRGALDGGPDGLDFYRRMAAAVPALLAPAGALIVELGAGQGPAVAELFAAAGLAPAPPHPDLMGTPRALVASKRA